MSFVDTEETAILAERYNDAGDTYELALHSATPGEGGSTTNEVAVPRQAITLTDASAGQPLTNTATIEFPDMPMVTVTAVSIHRVSTGGMISYGLIPDGGVPVPAEATLRFAAGALAITLD